MTLNSLGYVAVPAAGTPVRLTSGQPDPTRRVVAQTILVQVHPANTGVIYVGIGSGMNKTTGVGILAALPAPASATTGAFSGYAPSISLAPGPFNLADLYIDATVNSDKVIVSYTQG